MCFFKVFFGNNGALLLYLCTEFIKRTSNVHFRLIRDLGDKRGKRRQTFECILSSLSDTEER